MFSGMALLGWRDNIEVWGAEDTACRECAAGHLPKLFRRLWRQEAEVNLCRLTLCVSPLKLISYCLPFAGSIDISFYVIYSVQGVAKYRRLIVCSSRLNWIAAWWLCSSGTLGNDMQMRTLNWWLSPRFVYLLCIQHCTQQYSSGGEQSEI